MSEKKVSEAIEYRRSVRVFDDEKDIDPNIIKKCIEQAILAPNSRNLQLFWRCQLMPNRHRNYYSFKIM